MLIVCRGLPASGKTARARTWVAADPTRRARVNRDDLRSMLHENIYLGSLTEIQVVAAKNAIIAVLLDIGVDVVNDDTNLKPEDAKANAALVAGTGHQLEVWDLTNIPVETCVQRDARRAHPVGRTVIEEMAGKYL